jgi:DNA (cytosine-5)-methyltransferase 1
VFVVASARDGFDPATVLFEWEGVRRDSAPRREQGKVAPTIPSRSTGGGGLGTDFDCDGGLIARAVSLRGREGGGTAELGDDVQNCLRAACGGGDKPHVLAPIAFGGNNTAGPIDVATARNACASASGRMDFETETFLVQPVAFNARQDPDSWHDRTGPLDTDGGTQAVAFDTTQITSAVNRSNPKPGDPCHPLAAGAHAPAVAFQERGRKDGRSLEVGGDVAYALTAPNGGGRAQERSVLTPTMQVRRLTPTECARLQGFPDDYLDIPYRGKPAADGPKYKALGNSSAMPVVRWIGERIQRVIDLD